MTEEVDRAKVKKDLESWAAKIRKADVLIREVYADMNEVYKNV